MEIYGIIWFRKGNEVKNNMSKYNVGDKFTIEIKELINGSNDKMFYKSDCYSIIFGEEQLDKLQKYNEVKERLELIDELKMDEYNKGLEDGRNEAWELAKKLWHNDAKTNDDIYGIEYFIDIANEYTPQEALAKLEAYEKEQNKIKAGYVYEIMGKFCAVVQVDEFNNEYHIIWCDGGTDRIPFETPIGFKKTGKHIDIQSILQQIGE